MANEDVVAAIATPPGRGGIGVVRISGPKLQDFVRALVRKDVVPRVAVRARFFDRAGGVIDDGLVLYLPGPHSYTGEDVVEAQGHGGPVVLDLLLQRCVELGARLAEPGEFTRRAFLNDKLDLAQAEAVADLIAAVSIQAARSAQRSLQGEFSQRVSMLVQELQDLRVVVEAGIDFAEEDLDLLRPDELRRRIASVRQHLIELLAAAKQGSLLNEGVRAVLAGAPNVGKSSLMNRLAGMERAIVSDMPGTTRDIIRDTIAIEGVPIELLDTAGLRAPQDVVEAIGVSRTQESIAEADLLLWVSDATRPETRVMDPLLETTISQNVPRLHIVNKADLVASHSANTPGILVSAKTGEGLGELRQAILGAVDYGTGETVFLARDRHLQALKGALQHLEAAVDVAGQQELMAEEMRLAQEALAAITGEFTSDDLLGEIFSRFCIGK